MEEGEEMKHKIDKGENSFFLIFSWKLKKAYEKIFYPLAESLKLTQNEIDVLLFLYNNEPLDTASDIAKYRAMSKSMISKSVDGLYKRGYLSYEIDNIDKRCIHLKIEPEAVPMIEELHQVQKDFFDLLTQDITPKQYQAMEEVLNKMYQNINIIDKFAE